MNQLDLINRLNKKTSNDQNNSELFDLLKIVNEDLMQFLDDIIDFSENPFKTIPLYQKYKELFEKIIKYKKYFYKLDKNKLDINISTAKEKLIEKMKSITSDEMSTFENIFIYFNFIELLDLNQSNQNGGVINNDTDLLTYNKKRPNAKGAFGKVYFDTYHDFPVAIKKQYIESIKDFLTEIELYGYFSGLQIGPKILKSTYKQDMGVYVLQKYTSDVYYLMENHNLTLSQFKYLETYILHLIDIMLRNDQGYVCTDIKLKNILVNYRVNKNKNENVDVINEVVLHDFDKRFCYSKNGLSFKISEDTDLSTIHNTFKHLVLLSLLSSHGAIMKEKKRKYVKEKRYMEYELNQKILFGNLDCLKQIIKTITYENISLIHNSGILRINNNIIFASLHYIFSYVGHLCSKYILTKEKFNDEKKAISYIGQKNNISTLILYVNDIINNIIRYIS